MNIFQWNLNPNMTTSIHGNQFETVVAYLQTVLDFFLTLMCSIYSQQLDWGEKKASLVQAVTVSARIIMGMGSASEKRRYYVRPSLIGWALQWVQGICDRPTCCWMSLCYDEYNELRNIEFITTHHLNEGHTASHTDVESQLKIFWTYVIVYFN